MYSFSTGISDTVPRVFALGCSIATTWNQVNHLPTMFFLLFETQWKVERKKKINE
jgi:hypothetical protein